MTNDMDYLYSPLYNEGDCLYLFTNFGAPKGRIMTANIHQPGVNDWQVLVPEQQNVLSSASVIGRQLVLTYSQDACDHAFVYDLDGKMRHEVKLPMVGSVEFVGKETEPECFYTFTSFTQPGTVYRYDMTTNQSTLYTQPSVKFRLQDYESRQLFFQSKDGTRVPMFITYKKGMKLNGKNPVYLYGYGQKQNVFDDFISAAEYLIREGYTSKERLAIVGGSNGGLLVGACMTQRPDLFKVAIPEVGVMDMLRYHKFTIGWNWASDYGTSDDSKELSCNARHDSRS